MKRLFACVLGALLMAVPAMAQEGADFFKGKTMTYIVSTSPGGGYDTYGRLVARYLEKYLDANIVVRNMPGAGHIVGTNFLAASEPDGLTIGTFNTGLIYAQLLGQEGIQFDLTKMSWIGKAASDTRTIIVGKDSGIDDVDGLRSETPIKFAAAGVGSASYNETVLISEALDLNLEVIPGFNGKEDELAIMRGEIAGTLGSKSSLDGFVEDGNGSFVLDIGGAANPGIPQARDLAPDADGKAIVALIESQGSLARFTAGPPGIPADRLAALRDAYAKALADPDLLAEAEALGIPIDPAIGDDVANLVMAALDQPAEVVNLVNTVFNMEPPLFEVESELLAVEDGGRDIEFTGPQGETVAAGVSGSRTKVVIDGQESDRGSLEVGMKCRIEYDPANEDNEPKILDCKSS